MTDSTSPQAPPGDRLFALIASIPGSGTVDWCGPARALLDEIAAPSAAVSPPPATDRAALLREAADECDKAGAVYAARAQNEHAAGAFALTETFLRKANEAEYVATPCDFAACEPGGEPCSVHERLMAHAEGDHELCKPDCDPGRVGGEEQQAETQAQGAAPGEVLDLADGPVRCPLCPYPVTLHTPNGARAHFTTVHPEQRITGRGPGPWPLLVADGDEEQAEGGADQDGTLIDDYLRFLRGQGPEPDLTQLPPADREAIAGRFEIVRALADRDPELPPLDLDPVARRLGLHQPDAAPVAGQPPADTTGEGSRPRFVRVCVACPGCDHTLDENGACANGCHVPAAGTVHGCPPDGSGLTPCCGRAPFELPLTDRISSEVPVTCPGAVVSEPGKEK